MLLCVERSKCVSGFKEAVEIVKKHQLELEKGATSNYKGL
jgi:Ethanolamine utilization protein EutJ (predicted chaperonin)